MEELEVTQNGDRTTSLKIAKETLDRCLEQNLDISSLFELLLADYLDVDSTTKQVLEEWQSFHIERTKRTKSYSNLVAKLASYSNKRTAEDFTAEIIISKQNILRFNYQSISASNRKQILTVEFRNPQTKQQAIFLLSNTMSEMDGISDYITAREFLLILLNRVLDKKLEAADWEKKFLEWVDSRHGKISVNVEDISRKIKSFHPQWSDYLNKLKTFLDENSSAEHVFLRLNNWRDLLNSFGAEVTDTLGRVSVASGSFSALVDGDSNLESLKILTEKLDILFEIDRKLTALPESTLELSELKIYFDSKVIIIQELLMQIHNIDISSAEQALKVLDEKELAEDKMVKLKSKLHVMLKFLEICYYNCLSFKIEQIRLDASLDFLNKRKIPTV